MGQTIQPVSHRVRRRIHAAAAILSLAVWLLMIAAENWTPFHVWLHGGTIPDNDDDCAVVAIAHGKIEPVNCNPPAPVLVVWLEVTPCFDFSTFRPAIAILPTGRAPPVFSAAS